MSGTRVCTPDWGAAACAGWPTALFYPNSDGPNSMPGIRQAKVICGRCPLLSECLAYALEAQENYGIWGGCTERERRRMLRYKRDIYVSHLRCAAEAEAEAVNN